ncbi:MAG: TonB-dependent receptor [Bacteroidales bacterium]|nr:TonB-dependent receptor [Bacteroidales bacterium]
MFRKVLLTIGLLLAAQVVAFAQGTMKGTITDEKTGEPLMSANVVAKQGGQIMGGARTDFDGNYTIKGLQVGKYEIEVSYMGYATVKTEINVKATGFTIYNEKLAKSGQQLKEVVVKAQKVPVIEIGAPESGTRLSADDIGKMPANSVDGIVAAVAGVGYSDGGTGTARGEEGMVTQVGGVRTRTGVNVPKEAIAEIQVVLGGTPASIGEAIGGTQIITLKPPSTKFMGMVKYETMLDYRLWNSLVVWLTGPVAKTALKDEQGNKTGERTFVGFRFTGVGSYSKFGYYRAKDGRYQVVNDEKVMEIENTPIIYDPVERTVNYAAEFLRQEDFVTIKRPNANNYYASKDRQADFSSYSIDLQGALDFRFTEYTSLVLTGEYDFSYGPSTNLAYFPLNLHNAANGVSKQQNLVITADFTQRFKDPEPVKDESNPDAKTDPVVSKVMYNITAMYNRLSTTYYNERFGDDLFKYGHIGTFERTQTPSYEVRSDYNFHGTTQTAHIQNSWIETSKYIAPSEYNPILSNYTSQLYNIPSLAPYLTTFDAIRNFNGLVNGTSLPAVYSLFSNVGTQSTSYSKSLNNYYYIQAKAAATVKGHDLELGIQYDQYTASSYGLSAYSLWTLMRQSANAHISQLDFNNPVEYFVGSDLYVDYNRLNGGGQTCFDASLREALGLDVNGTDWLDIDRYSPEQYNEFGGINMFSANELFNSGNQLVSYFGYDHTGEKYNASTWSLDDFFDPVSRGHKNFQYLPAFSPIYAAGYIQDKFYFQDLIFNVGVRVDYYDGNQMVLKDPYLLYESYTVADLNNGKAAFTTGLANNEFPASAKEDWVVYVDDAGSTNPTIRGYREGTNWYNADGVQVTTPSAIAGESGRPTPYRTTGEGGGQQTATTGNASGNRISANAFKDYDPQIVVMPRIAFSFPVNDMSQFKANYDIIARRPSSGWQADYFQYLFMTQANGYINNPNLKPERITNYELGFQQALNKDKTAALSISAYYKETRDLIQVVQYAGADPNPNYYSYDNLDFKTIKGFSLSFDMRQSNNVRINANYTLQYAEGTGLSTTTMSELIKEGYTTLKMLNPISDDRRHEFKANVDYRLGKNEGFHYTRTVKDKDGNARKKDVYPLQNFGVNFIAVAQSGRPYTKAYSNTQNTIVGSYRGARLPWGFYFDVVLDKTWPIEIKKEGKKARQTMLQAALTVRNLFDIRNVTGVFSVTGNPSDNGYLTDPETQSVINAYLDPQSYRDMYSIMLSNNYWNWSQPRTIRLSLTYQF